MPFGTTLERESDGYQLFAIGIDDVDHEQDRLAVLFAVDGETDELLFTLVNDEAGTNLLRLDQDNSSGEAVSAIHDSMRQELELENPEQTAVYMLADTITDSTDLMLTLPPTLVAILNGLSCMCELDLEDGETVSIESRTL